MSGDGLSSAVLGAEWYEFFLTSWLGVSVAPKMIFAFGEAQTKLAVARRRALQNASGFEGDDDGFAMYLRGDKFQVSDSPQIAEGFVSAQATVRDNIGKQFFDNYGAPAAVIAKAQSEQMAAVPGYYNIEEETFYFNVLGGKYDLRERDWLFLHEATPGHHFQLWIHGNKNTCNTALANARFPVFIEGWAAYVETIGGELGLYTKPEYELSAVDWDLVRSVRVALDVALNYYGWSDERALEYWRRSIQGKDDIAMREIARMRRWPAQVVTYKYGADVFLRSKEAMAAAHGDGFDVRAYHDLALSYGDMPFGVFEDLVNEQTAAGKDKP